MGFLNRWEQRLRPFAIPQLTLGLVLAQVVAYIALFAAQGMENQGAAQRLMLIPDLVMAGEVWRLITFLAVPPVTNPIFAFFFWYIFFMMGSALEQNWGDFRYNLYLLIGYLATVAVSFLTPSMPASNGYLQASVFLAFAQLYPNFELRLFFILPVKVKWLALIAWIGYFLTVAFGSWNDRLLVLASVGNFFLFFGKEIKNQVIHGQRRMATQAKRISTKSQPYFHRCTTCGITDRDNPTMEFRYCSKCADASGYCSEHIHNHEHVTEAETK